MDKVKISLESYQDLLRCNTNQFLSEMLTTADRNEDPKKILDKAIAFAATYMAHFFEVDNG